MKKLVLVGTMISLSILTSCKKNEPTPAPTPRNESEKFIKFTDPEFERYCIEAENGDENNPQKIIDTNNDGKISYKEATDFTGDMMINTETIEYNVKSLEDLKFFPNIKRILAGGLFELKKIDFRENKHLISVGIIGSQITDLDLSMLTDLSGIILKENPNLKALDLNNNPKVGILFLEGSPKLRNLTLNPSTPIEELIITRTSLSDQTLQLPKKLDKIKTLQLDSTNINYLPIIAKCPNLDTFQGSLCQATKGEADFSQNPKIKNVIITLCPGITGIKLAPNSKLEQLTLENTSITTFDSSNLENLYYIDLMMSPNLTEANIANGINDKLKFLGLTECPKLNTVIVDESIELPLTKDKIEKMSEGEQNWYFDTDKAGNPRPKIVHPTE